MVRVRLRLRKTPGLCQNVTKPTKANVTGTPSAVRTNGLLTGKRLGLGLGLWLGTLLTGKFSTGATTEWVWERPTKALWGGKKRVAEIRKIPFGKKTLPWVGIRVRVRVSVSVRVSVRVRVRV